MMLPKKLKSGRRLVATSAGGHVGLYRKGDPEGDDYRVRLPTGKTTASLDTGVSYGGVPLAPEGQHWTWRAGKRPDGGGGRKVRERKSTRESLQPKTEQAPKELPVSATHLCTDCGRNVHLMLNAGKHAHSVRADRGHALTICCRCVRKRGILCAVYAKANKARLRREHDARSRTTRR